MVTANTYGTYQPKAMEPFPIETNLAIASLGSESGAISAQNASNLLAQYQGQRQLSGETYGREAAAQHQFAYDQLASQIADQKAKALIDAGDKGGLGLLGTTGYLQGVDPAAIARRQAQYDAAQGATNLEHAGAGINSMTTAGFQPDAAQVGGVTGFTGLTRQAPVPVQVAQIHAASAAANAGDGGPTSINIPGLPGANGEPPIGMTFGRKSGIRTPEDAAAYARSHGMPGFQAPVAPGGGGTTAPPPKGGTNLPPLAKRDTPANNAIERLDNKTPGVDRVEQQLRASITSGGGGLSPGQVAAAKRGMQGGRLTLGRDAGGVHILDDKGQIVK